MARTFVNIEDIINDYMINRDEDDYAKITSRSRVRNLALAALRDLQYDSLRTFKAVVIDLDKDTMSIDFPEDYINYIRIGILNQRNEFITLVRNQNLPNLNGVFLLDGTGAKLLDSDGIELQADYEVVGQTGTIDSRTGGVIYRDFYRDNSRGRLYGASGGNSWAGSYREDNENGKVYFSTDFPADQDSVVFEYLADETMKANPRISIYAEEAVKNYIYWKHVQRKANVGQGEKRLAKKEYVLEKEKAMRRLQSATKSEIIAQYWNGNSQTAPKTGGKYFY